MNKRFSTHGPMTCGQSEAQERTYKLITGKTGRRWLVAIQPNEADNVYCEGGPNSDGFGGATLTFKLDDGTTIALAGPWHSNADSLFDDTGYDCRDKYTSLGIIGLGRESDWNKGDLYKEVLHYDKKPVIGNFDRIEKLAQEKANELGKEIFYSVRTSGGGCSWCCQPKGAFVSREEGKRPGETSDPGDPNFNVVELI